MSDEWVADGGRRSRRVKASAMTFQEMTDMVQVLDEKDYDGRLANYTRPNTRKDKIMEKVVRRLRRRYSVERSKDQLRKRWSDLKHREEEQLRKIRKIIKKNKKRERAAEEQQANAEDAAGQGEHESQEPSVDIKVECEESSYPTEDNIPVIKMEDIPLCLQEISSTGLYTMTDSEVLHFHFEQQANGILHKMNILREQNLFCDVSIYINDAEFHGHKVVFAACSTFMRDQFLLNQSRQVHITILQNADVGQKLLLSCYTGVLQVRRKELLKYLTAASYLQMVHIVEKCTEALSRYLQCETWDNAMALKPEEKPHHEPQMDTASSQDKDCEIIELSEDSQLNMDFQVKKEENDQEPLQSPRSKNEDLSAVDIDYKEGNICVFQMGSMSDNADNADNDQFPQPCTSSKSNIYFSDTQHSIINSTVDNRVPEVQGGPYPSYQEGGESSAGAMQGLQSTAEWTCSWRHQCPKCPRGFLHLENYLRHLKMHKLFLCLQCGKTFTQKKNLNRHIRGHMGIRPFQCSVCLKTFTAKSTLQDHLNIHSGDRPYKCHCCDMDFKHKSALKKHLNSVHGKNGGDKSTLDITKVTIDYD